MPEWTPDQRLVEYEAALIERLNMLDATLDAADENGPLLSVLDCAALGGVSRFAIEQAHARTKKGQSAHSWPRPDEAALSRYRRLMFPAFPVLDYFVAVGNWPLGVAGRVTADQLFNLPSSRQLGQRIRLANIDDGRTRSILQWTQYADKKDRQRAAAEARQAAAAARRAARAGQ